MGVSDEEWEDGPLPEGEPGARVRQGMTTFVWVSGVWRCGPEAAYAPGEDIGLWRWLQKPGELEALRERARGGTGWLSERRADIDEHAALRTIVGEVQQALAGKPAEECVTDEGRAVAWLWHAAAESDEAASASSFREARDVAHATLANTRALCTKNGWTSG